VREDQLERLRFAPLQDGQAREVLAGANLDEGIDTIVLQEADGRLAVRSDAVVGVLQRLGGLWGLVGGALAVVPRRVRNAGYDLVGRHRMRVFGRAASACPILPAALAKRFVGGPTLQGVRERGV
jgi:predicted DCC family thiol-disulfide oxidoreductase YuxK